MIQTITIMSEDHEFEMNAGDVSSYFNQVTGLEMPEFRTSTYVLAGRHGAQTAKQLYGKRIVTINGGIDATTCTNHLALRSDLITVHDDAVAAPVSVVVGTSDGKAYRMIGRMLKPELPVDNKFGTEFQLTFIQDGYLIQNLTDGIPEIRVDKRVDGGLRWLSSSGLRWNATSGFRWSSGATPMNAINSATFAIKPSVILYGPLQNPVLRNITTGQQLAINATIGIGDVIQIDFQTKNVTLNGGNINALVATGSKFFSLEPENNLIELTTSAPDTGFAIVSWYKYVIGL